MFRIVNVYFEKVDIVFFFFLDYGYSSCFFFGRCGVGESYV